MIDLKKARQDAEKVREEQGEKLFQRVVAEIPAKIREATGQGKNHATAVEIEDFGEQWARLFLSVFFLKRSLIGGYKQIFEHCKKEGLRPSVLTYGYADATYSIMIKW